MARIYAVALLALGLVGCASHSGVVATGPGTYMINKQAATGFPGLGNLKADIMTEGGQYCASQGQQFLLLRATEFPPYPFGGYPRAEIEFRCVPAGRQG